MPETNIPATDQPFSLPKKPFKVVELEQGTTEWREWRHHGIGGSDASIIMGENRYSHVEDLLLEKKGPPRDGGQNAAMALGTRLEPEARRRYNARTGKQMTPVCLQSTEHEWLRASLDGICVNHASVVEIKCGKTAYRLAYQTGAIPVYYRGQLQHILAVTGLNTVDFWCCWPGCRDLLIQVQRNEDYIQRLLEKEFEFWKKVKSDVTDL